LVLRGSGVHKWRYSRRSIQRRLKDHRLTAVCGVAFKIATHPDIRNIQYCDRLVAACYSACVTGGVHRDVIYRRASRCKQQSDN
jgi:hypothetical protein